MSKAESSKAESSKAESSKPSAANSYIMSFENYQKMVDKTTFISTNPLQIRKPHQQINYYIPVTSRFRRFTTTLYKWFIRMLTFNFNSQPKRITKEITTKEIRKKMT
jgi:hypothetical protein